MSSDEKCAVKRASPGYVEKRVIISNALGLHARPAAKLAQTAQRFQSQITLEYSDTVADAKSILDILTLAATQGAVITLRCRGNDAACAAKELEALFHDGGMGEL